MSNIDSLIHKIIQDGENEANNIIQAAEKEGTQIVQDKKNEAEKLRTKIIESAKQEGKSKGQRVISNTELEIRNSKLTAKHQVIDMVLNMVLEGLTNMEMDKYLKLMRDFLNNMELEGNMELIVPNRYRNKVLVDFIEELNNNSFLKSRKLYISLCKDDRDIHSGFILIKEGVEINNTFETVITSLRDELEWQAAENLFE